MTYGEKPVSRAVPVWIVCGLIASAVSFGGQGKGDNAVVDPGARGNRTVEEEIIDLTKRLVAARAAGDLRAEADALFRLAVSTIDGGDLHEAQRLAEQSLDAARNAEDPTRQAWATLALGDVRFFWGEWEASRGLYLEAFHIFEEQEDRFSAASALKSVGIATKLMGHVEDGIEALLEAAATFEELGTLRDLHSALENIGSGYLALGDTTQAEIHLQQALALARELDNETSAHHTLVRLAALHLDVGFPELALREAREAREITERLGLRLHESWPASLEGRALAELGRVEEAIVLEHAVLEHAKRIGSPSFLVGPYLRLGRLHLDRYPEQALHWYEQADSAAGSASFSIGWMLDTGYGRVYRRLQRFDEAIEHYEKALIGIEAERENILFDRFRAAHLDRNRGIYAEMIETLYEQGRRTGDSGHARHAFTVLERANARSLIESIAETDLEASWPLDNELRERRTDLNRAISRLQREITNPATMKLRREEIRAELDTLDADWARWIADVKRGYPRFASIRYPQPVDINGARSVLGAGTALVAYFAGSEHFYAFVLSSTSYDLLKLEAAVTHVDARVRTLLDLLPEGEAKIWRPVAGRLHQELLEPVRAKLPVDTRRLIVVPDGSLHFLPFDILLRPRDGRFAIEDFEITLAPSATVLRRLREARAPDPTGGLRPILVFADPTVPGNGEEETRRTSGPGARAADYTREGFELPDLPFTAEEARAISRFAPQGSEVHLGEAATESKLKDRPLDHFGVIHFATHGLISSERPMRSALLLSRGDREEEDGFLQVREIYGLTLASDLIVLSVCRSARGRLLSGEGVESLGQAFLHAGAKAVVASVLDVPDDQTVTLMERFYEGLSRGLDKGEALRQAKLAVLRAGTAATSTWAGFVLIGDGDGVVRLATLPRERSLPARLAGPAAALALMLAAVALIVRVLNL